MLIGRVVGNIVATQKSAKFHGEKLLLVQPLDLSGASRGVPIIAIDRMGAGTRERVLYTQDGRTAQQILGRGTAGVDAAILGIIDEIDFGPAVAAPPNSSSQGLKMKGNVHG